MKKKLLTILCVICTIACTGFFASCLGGGEPYNLDASDFNSQVVYGSSLNYDAFLIESDSGELFLVNESMVTGWDTSSVGEKTFIITFDGMQFEVDYTVKYEVKFVANGQVISTQYVLSASEIQAPSGYDFEIPAQISDNTTIEEQSNTTEVEIVVGDVANELPVGASGVTLPVSVTGTSAWEVSLSNDNITARKMNGMVLISANSVGVTDLTISAGGKYVTKTIVIKPESLTITQSGNTYGIENIYTIGRTNVNGEVTKTVLGLSCAKQGVGFSENVTWSSSSENATIKNGEITLAQGSGVEVVTFTAEFFGVKATFDVRCVYNGVNVSNYADLHAATKAKKIIVLGSDIAFPTNVSEIKYETVHTTYDDTYYKNIGKQDQAIIKVLLQFKNDLYGNGYEINAHNATLGLLDATGNLTSNSIFKGPLDFVALTESGITAASFKGQDNVCFGIYEGVTVNNVILKGANIENDLTELNYAGTTVEVFGDNVNIEYSRIMNGRTVLRVFGDEVDANKVINVNVKNSVLSGAREFIIRMGSNAFVNGTSSNASPYIGEQLNLIGIKNGSVQKPANYEDDYIKTFVTLENCVLKDAGIFAIGIDAHFAGTALQNASGYVSVFAGFASWYDLAKTSYGAKLTFNGEVKMYNWIKAENIDSSTIIDINEQLLGEEFTKMLKFDIGALIEIAANKYPTVITNDGYVHAGIVFFGGGKNYGLFEDNTNLNLESFEVSLYDIDKGSLGKAAGFENFYFNIYDRSTTGITPEMQNNMSEADMYACIYKK